MSSNKTKQDFHALKQLLNTFHATWQGEGDINAGTNLLVARAIALANLSRTGSGIQIQGGTRIRGGCSLLVSGGLSSSLVMDGLVTEVGIRQNNLTAQLRREIGDKIADAQKKGAKMVEFPSGPGANSSENALFQLEQKDSLIPVEPLELWSETLRSPPNPRIDDLAARPKILVTTKGPRDLDKQLNSLHDGRPLVVLTLNEAADANAYASTCSALLNGLYPVGSGSETASAHLLINDPDNVLARIAPRANEKEAWLGRMIWLVDGTTGPDAIEDAPCEGQILTSDMGGRFGEALNHVLAKRLNNHQQGVVVHKFDLGQAQIRWVAFLKNMDSRLPGISGTARSLLATLALGLTELAKAPGFKRHPVTPESVEALGRWVIQRMANARAAMLGSAAQDMRRALAMKILSKIGDDRVSKRDIYRSVGIPVCLCEEVLHEMQLAGIVSGQKGKWKRVLSRQLLNEDLNELFIEV